VSIYATWLSLGDDEHEEGCAVYKEDPPGSGIFEWSDKPCDCDLLRCPLKYAGSHILPSMQDARTGWLDVAAIPDHVTREGQEFGGEGERKPFLRLSVGFPYCAIVLPRDLVVELRDTLSAWLDAEEVA
jgi:hypothetical protein